MSDPVEAHIKELRDSGYSPATLRARVQVLITLPDLEDMDRETTREWWESRKVKLDGTPKALASLSSEASHARAFWKWCRAEGLLDHNPGDWIPAIRQKKTKAVAVSEADLYRAMTDAPDDIRRMIALAAMAGLRSAEIAVVTWEDIHRDTGTLRVSLGKGAKDRDITLSGGLLAELGDPGTGPIVGREMTAKSVSAALGRYLRSKGIDYSAHKLRARFITRFIAATGDAVAAAELAGHSDLTSILRYAVPNSDTMRRGVEAAGRIG
jgi:integrase